MEFKYNLSNWNMNYLILIRQLKHIENSIYMSLVNYGAYNLAFGSVLNVDKKELLKHF
jgi:hypothetical protein